MNLILVWEVCTQITIFSSKMNQEISDSKWYQGRTLLWLGAVASKNCMRTLRYPPTTSLFLQLKSKLDFGVRGSHIFQQNAPRNLSFKMVPKENLLLVGCSSLHIVYENIVLPSYHFFFPAVEE